MRSAARPCGAAVLILCAFAALARGAEPPRVSVQLEPDPLGLDELATFTLAVESRKFGGVDVEPEFRLDNFEIAGGPFRSTSQSWVNGVTSSTTQLVWRLRPLAVGTARVTALSVKIEGALRQLPDASLQVVERAPPRAAPPRASADPFGSLFGADPFGGLERRRPRLPRSEPKLRAHATVQPSSVWIGQQIGWRLILDTQTDISRIEPRSMPDFRGFWSHDVTPDRTPPPQWIEAQGERFARVAVLERALFPLKAGILSLPRVELAVSAQIVDADRFIPIVTPKLFELTTQPLTVVARPLPAPPPGFTGIVGRLELAASVDRTELEAGQAASLTLSVTSDGNLQSVEAPRLALPGGLRSFPPTREAEERVLGGRLESTVRWRYVLLADRPGSYALPAFELAHFEPASASYRTARAAGPELSVRAALALPAETMPAVPAAAATSDVPRRQLAPIARAVAVAAVAALLIGAAVALTRRRRRTGRPAAALSAALDAGAREPSARAAAAAIEEAWRRFLADRWSIPRSLPSAQWTSRLAEKRGSEELGRELESLFEELHLLAFAPELAEVEAHRADVLDRSRRLLRRLR